MKSIVLFAASLMTLSSLVGCAETSTYGYGRMEREADLRDRITIADARLSATTQDRTAHPAAAANFSEASRNTNAKPQ